VNLKGKRAKQRQAALYIARLMRESLQQFPQEEQDRRVKEGHRIALKIGPEKRGKLSKRLSSASRRPSPRKSSVER